MKKINSILAIALLSHALYTFSDQAPTTLLQEVRNGNKEAIKKRLENCENCAQKDEDGNNALHIAGEEGTKDHEEIIDMLTTEQTSWQWWTSCFGYFAPTLPDKNAKNKQGKVPLRSAIDRGNVQATEKLLTKGADPKITDTEGISPVFAVVKENKPQFIPVLAQYQLIKQKFNGQNILHYAINLNQLSIVDKLATDKILTQEEDNEGKTPAMLAAEKNDASCLRILHVKGVNLTARNHLGRQPIHSSALAGSYEAAKYLLELENGANVDSNDNNENTPLLLSTAQGKKDMVNLFLAYKADPKKRNKQGKDILDMAVDNKHIELVKRFKEIPGVNIDARDAAGRTNIMNAVIAQNHPMVLTLYQCGADIYITDNDGENIFHKAARNDDTHSLALLKDARKDYWNKPNLKGNKPHFVAAQKGNFNSIILFVGAGGSLEETNNAGETIFHQIAQSKNKGVLEAVINKYHPRININAQSAQGLSAIHYASAYDDVEMMNAFVAHGASYSDTTPQGNTLAHTAAQYGSLNALKDLKYRKPSLLQDRNNNNHTPFIVAAAHGHFDSAQFLFCEDYIINRDISLAISLARQYGHTHIVQSLEQVEKKRMDECVKITRQAQEIINIQKKITSLYEKLAQKDGAYLLNIIFSPEVSPKQYSANELYYMTHAQRTQISLGYIEIRNQVLERKRNVKNRLDSLITQEEEQRRQKEKRIRDAQRQEQARIDELNRRERELQEARERNAAAQAQRKRELEQKKQQQEADLAQIKEFHRYEQEKLHNDAAKKAQQEEIDRCNKEKAAKEQATRDKAAAAKALADKEQARQQQHAAALDKQQEHVPMNLKPSAPPMDQKGATYTCTACGKESSAKTLPCKTCPKRICNACQKQNGGQCPACWQNIGKFAQKIKGGCFICTEKNIDVTTVPCNTCKVRNDHICKECLNDCIEENKKNNLEDKCPLCTHAHMLDKKIIKIILSQK